jgi:hypothetical protein
MDLLARRSELLVAVVLVAAFVLALLLMQAS